jgi:hypothetical protein
VDSVFLKDGTDDSLVEERNNDPLQFLNKVFDSCATRACGFKLSLNPSSKLFNQVIEDSDIRKILLHRPNLLAVHSSEQIASTSRVWVVVNTSDTNRLHKLAFVHIPKTGGWSLHNALAGRFGSNKTIRINDQNDRTRFLSMDTKNILDHEFVSGHVSKQELISKHIVYPTVSLLRHPIERLAAIFLENRSEVRGNPQKFSSKAIQDFADDLQNSRQLDMQCWHICGTHSSEAAIEMIHKYSMFVAPSERSEDIKKTLSSLMKIELGKNGDDVNHNMPRPKLAKDQVEILENLVKEDMKLYEYVKANQERIRKDFVKQATKFVSDNQKSMTGSREKPARKIIFDKEEFERRISTIKNDYDATVDKLNETNQAYLFHTYEDFLNERLFRRVFPFLGLGQPEMLISHIVKQNRYDVLSRYHNPHAVMKFLKDEGKIRWVSEEPLMWY